MFFLYFEVLPALAHRPVTPTVNCLPLTVLTLKFHTAIFANQMVPMKVNLFCPLIKQECKKDECIMWKYDTCLISIYLISNIMSSASISTDNNSKHSDTNSKLVEELFSGFAIALDNNGQDAPNEELELIFSKSVGELADEIIQFAKEEQLINNNGGYLSHEIEDLFWSHKGLEVGDKELPHKYRTVKKKAWLMASTKASKETKLNRYSLSDSDSSESEKEILSESIEVLAKQLLSFAKGINLNQDEAELLGKNLWSCFGNPKEYNIHLIYLQM